MRCECVLYKPFMHIGMHGAMCAIGSKRKSPLRGPWEGAVGSHLRMPGMWPAMAQNEEFGSKFPTELSGQTKG